MSQPTENTILSEKNFIQLIMGKFYKSKDLYDKEETKRVKDGATELVQLIKTYPIDIIEIIKFEAIQDYLLEHGYNDESVNDEILILKGLKQRPEPKECEE